MEVLINSECTGCGLCESVNSDVFYIQNNKAHVHSANVAGNESDCRIAADQCPVGAIEIM